jgi:hypothetical protein
MRQLTVTDARREAAKAKIALSGGPGFGKTWTALRIARVLSPDGTVMVIDTEHESAKLYAPPFAFKHAPWAPPYEVPELVQAIDYYARYVDVLIIDSLSHFWQGEGGVLDVAAGKFTGWKTARPIQRQLTEAIVRADCHLIGCMRSKVEYAQEQGRDGKQVVTRLGVAEVQDDTMPYEFTVAADLDAQHRLAITKTRCVELDGKVYPPHREVEMAQVLLGWLAGPAATGGDVAPPSSPVVFPRDSALLRAAQQDAAADGRRVEEMSGAEEREPVREGKPDGPGDRDDAAPATTSPPAHDSASSGPEGGASTQAKAVRDLAKDYKVPIATTLRLLNDADALGGCTSATVLDGDDLALARKLLKEAAS